MIELSANTQRELHALRLQWKNLLALTVVVMAMYFLVLFVSPGWVTFIASIPALAIMMVTSVCRLNDISSDKNCRRWNTRRFGFILTGLATITLIGMPFGLSDFPSWNEVFLRWGVALVWLTTPNMIPWWTWAWNLRVEDVCDQPKGHQ